MELCTYEKAVFFLPVNMLMVWSPAFLAAQHTTVCLDIVKHFSHLWHFDIESTNRWSGVAQHLINLFS